METPPPVSKAARVGGWLMAVPPVFMLLMSGMMKVTQNAEVTKGFANWPAGVAVPIGVVEIACTLIYLVPCTSVLGAILLTGYLGGAVATTVQMGAFKMIALPASFGVLLWGALWLRDPQVRALIPLKRAG